MFLFHKLFYKTEFLTDVSIRLASSFILKYFISAYSLAYSAASHLLLAYLIGRTRFLYLCRRCIYNCKLCHVQHATRNMCNLVLLKF